MRSCSFQSTFFLRRGQIGGIMASITFLGNTPRVWRPTITAVGCITRAGPIFEARLLHEDEDAAII